jgi:signal transduction histidine kinase
VSQLSTERLALARELHDGIAQDLVGIGYSLDLLLADPAASIQDRSELRRTRLQIDSLIAKVRKEIFNLRTASLPPLEDRLQSILNEILHNVTYEFIHENVIPSGEVADEIVAITSEILRNIQMHSRASHVQIRLYPVHNRTCLEVCDNGIGGIQMREDRFGLQGILERVENLGGSITIENSSGTQFVILL